MQDKGKFIVIGVSITPPKVLSRNEAPRKLQVAPKRSEETMERTGTTNAIWLRALVDSSGTHVPFCVLRYYSQLQTGR
jgi:hypothetical protein